MTTTTLYQNEYYQEIASTHCNAPVTGAFFYSAIFFSGDIFGAMTVHQVADPKRGTPFTFTLIPHDDAFESPTERKPKLKPHEELVSIKAKQRPVVILSPESRNKETALVVPSYSLANKPDDRVKLIRKRSDDQYFYLPECTELGIRESALDIKRIQQIKLNSPFSHPGNCHPSKPVRHYLRLTDNTLADLRSQIGNYLSIS